MASKKSRTSASSSLTDEWTYDVFISFRGVDTRLGFTGNLYNALRRVKGVKTFMDDQDLEPGEEITPALIKAIQESRIALVIFSKNYATSAFCLEELANIMECSIEKDMLVWPVFYQVDPADVRYQRGSYAEALAKHEARFEEEKIKKWRAALKKAADRSGSHLRSDGYQYEYQFIDKIIQDICKKISSLRDRDKNQSSQLSRKSGKECYILAARDLGIVWGDTPECWNWINLPESRFPEVAKLVGVSFLEIRGVINTNALSPNTQYAAYLVYKMINGYSGFQRYPVGLSVDIFGGECTSPRNACLDPIFDKRRVLYSLEGLQRPNMRSDGWFEIEMGEFFNSGIENEVRMSVLETMGGELKRGLIIEGIEVRPKDGD